MSHVRDELEPSTAHRGISEQQCCRGSSVFGLTKQLFTTTGKVHRIRLAKRRSFIHHGWVADACRGNLAGGYGYAEAQMTGQVSQSSEAV